MPRSSKPYPILMLARPHFDPSGNGYCARIRLESEKTEWQDPNPGTLALLADDGGARLIRLRRKVTVEGDWVYWDFDRVNETSETRAITLSQLAEAYRPVEEAPKLPMGKKPAAKKKVTTQAAPDGKSAAAGE